MNTYISVQNKIKQATELINLHLSAQGVPKQEMLYTYV